MRKQNGTPPSTDTECLPQKEDEKKEDAMAETQAPDSVRPSQHFNSESRVMLKGLIPGVERDGYRAYFEGFGSVDDVYIPSNGGRDMAFVT